jgi:threonine aldolase
VAPPAISWVESVVPVETNIVVAILKDHNKRDEFIEKLKNKNCLIMAFGPGMLRMVTHLDISFEDIESFCSNLKRLN